MKAFVITKDESNMIKGIAIILMMIHHFWSSMQPIPVKIVVMGGQISNIELMIGSMCKICVSLFAFLTGWVLYLNPKFKSYSYNFRKAKSFILNYWIAELIFIIVGFMFCLKLPSFSILLANLFGFETGAYEIMGYDYVNVTFAWYVRFYLFLLLSFPILLRCLNLASKVRPLLSFIGFILFFGIMCYLCRMSDNYFVRKLLAVYFEWIPCVVVGYYFNRYGWFRYFERINTKLLCIFFILYLLLCYKFSVGYNSDWFSAIILVWLCMKAIHRIHSKVLVRLGKASMFIWFIHGLFFLPTKPLEPLILINGNTIALLLLGVFWSIIFSFMVLYLKDVTLKLFSRI